MTDDEHLRDAKTRDYKQCEVCGQYLDADGTCPESHETPAKELNGSGLMEKLFPDGPGCYRNNFGPGPAVVKLTDEEVEQMKKEGRHCMSVENAWSNSAESSHAVKPLGPVHKVESAEEAMKMLESGIPLTATNPPDFPPTTIEDICRFYGVPRDIFDPPRTGSWQDMWSSPPPGFKTVDELAEHIESRDHVNGKPNFTPLSPGVNTRNTTRDLLRQKVLGESELNMADAISHFILSTASMANSLRRLIELRKLMAVSCPRHALVIDDAIGYTVRSIRGVYRELFGKEMGE